MYLCSTSTLTSHLNLRLTSDGNETAVDHHQAAAMSIQVSIPLAIHLRRQVTGNIFSGEHFRPGEVS